MPTLRSALGVLSIVLATVAVATGLALVVDRGFGLSAPYAPIAAALVAAAVFWWRPPGLPAGVWAYSRCNTS